MSFASAPGASHSHLARSGHSVQILDPPPFDQLSHQVISPAFGSANLLSDYSIHHLPSFEGILAGPVTISQEDLDEIVPVDCTVKDLATTNWQQHTHTLAAEQSSLSFTRLLLDSTAGACPPAEYKQQPHQIPVRFTPGRSPDSSLSITNSEMCQRAYQRAYHSAYHKTLRAEIRLSDDIVKARQAARGAGRAAGKAAGKAERERVKGTPGCVSGEFHAITPGEAYNRAYSKTYRAEINISGDKVRARQAARTAGQAAAQAQREQVQACSVSPPGISLPPNPREGYQKAYHRAFRCEMALSGDTDKAKKAGQAAGKAASVAASRAIEERVKESSLLAKTKWIPIRPLL